MESYLVYIDAVVFLAGVFGALGFTIWQKKTANIGIRAVPFYFASFGASLITSSMAVGHLFENSYRAMLRAMEGSFVFNFHFYSILLMGIVILSQGAYMLLQLRLLAMGDYKAKKRFIITALLLSAITAPVFLFRPIGILPTVACIISLSGLLFSVKPVSKPSLTPVSSFVA